jgi:hypothetical protein
MDQTFSAEGQNQSATATFSDLAGNTATSNALGINIDLTAPTLQFGAPSPAPNGAGWNNSNVSIAFTASDALSGVSSTSTSSPLVLSAEGTNVTGTVTVTDVAGNSASFVSPAAKIDKTKPVASATQSPLPDSSGWNNTDVTVTFTGTDSLSGIQGCSAPVVLTTNGSNQSASGTCTDLAGNVSNPATISGININKNPNPTLPSISGLPAAGCTIWPPNKQMVQIADVTVTGIVTGSLSVTVSSSEPVATPDIGVKGGAVQVRADRNGSGTDRIYTVTAAAMDAAGRPITASGSCIVPHDSSEKPDSGAKKKK